MEQVWNKIMFWGVWLIIPLVMDISSGIYAWWTVVNRKREDRIDEQLLEYFPDVTVIVPVFNSAQTLKLCMESIMNQTYPKEKIEVLLINNGSQDESYDLYCEIQSNYNLKMWWLDASKGKAKALNKGLYSATGKYIINIDSDGILEENAIKRMVYKFEQNAKIDALTGVVLINQDLIKQTEGFLKRILQKCEFFEYSEAFLVGRGYESSKDKMFTLAGAYSAFRKSVVLKTQLYNGETLGEDTHMTIQIREYSSGSIELCENAYFFVDPIESLDRLYIQRQRWQRGEIEVAVLFEAASKKFSHVLKQALIKDHTLVFPRLIWMFAMIYLAFIDYPIEFIIGANAILYMCYVMSSLLFFTVGLMYLDNVEPTRKYMRRNFLIVFCLPFYRMLIFFMRAAGIINAVEQSSKWNTRTFADEKQIIEKTVYEKFEWYIRLKKWVNSDSD